MYWWWWIYAEAFVRSLPQLEGKRERTKTALTDALFVWYKLQLLIPRSETSSASIACDRYNLKKQQQQQQQVKWKLHRRRIPRSTVIGRCLTVIIAGWPFTHTVSNVLRVCVCVHQTFGKNSGSCQNADKTELEKPNAREKCPLECGGRAKHVSCSLPWCPFALARSITGSCH